MKKEEFRILTSKEERALSKTELTQYYKELRENIVKRKLTNTTPGATTIAPMLKKPTNKIAKVVTKLFSDKNVEWICDGKENILDGTVILAHTHQGILDGFLWIPHFDRHCLILHSAVTSKLLLACQLNTGLVLVKKGDKVNSHNAKLDMIKLLLKGHSISYYPESAWNLSPNKLHLPMSYGFLDVARKANVPIIPVVHEFTYASDKTKEKITKIHSRFGKPIYITPDDDINEKLAEYEEAISTIRWELIEKKGLYRRTDISPTEYRDYLNGNIKNLEMGGIDINVERQHLFSSNDDFYKFHHINDVPCATDGTLLETEEVQKIKMLNYIHNI